MSRSRGQPADAREPPPGRRRPAGIDGGAGHGTLFRIGNALLRGLRLRCPCCGHGRLFQSAFLLYERCSACGEAFEREPGEGIGSVYVNLVFTAAVTLSGFALTHQFTTLSATQQIALWTPVAALLPLVFFRFAKGLWIGLVFLGEGLYLDWPSR